jgi:putative ABC transport system permease protein
MQSLLRDIRFGLRSLLRSPAFTIAAVATLALGIGANTAIFSAVHAILLRPLTYPDAERIAVVWTTTTQSERDVAPYPLFAELRERSTTLAGLAALTRTAAEFTEAMDPEEVPGAGAAGDFFRVLGVEPILGRTFAPVGVEEGNDDIVVLSHGLWTRRFGADTAIVGTRIRIGVGTREVVGVMPPGFAYPDGAEFWIPLVRTPSMAPLFESRESFWLELIGRLAPDASLSRADAELNALMEGLAEDYPDGIGISVESLRETIVGDVRPALLVLLGAVGFVLLIACANVANLLLARGAARRKELALRSALGASGARLVRQVLTESMVLALLGGAAGVLVALWGTSVLIAASPPDLPRLDHVRVNGAVLAFAAGIALLAGLFFGLAPAFSARTVSVGARLREGGRGTGGDAVGRVRPVLITLQVALALVLLVGAGLLVRSFAALQSVDPGFRTENVLSFRLTLGSSRYPGPEQNIAFRRELMERLEAMPDVESVRGINTLLLARLPNSATIEIDGQPPAPGEQQSEVTIDVVDPGFFAAMRVPLVRGRDFGMDDIPTGPPVAIVNDAFVRRYFPAEDPIGRRFRWNAGPAQEFTIVGVAADMHRSGLTQPVRPQGFRSAAQLPTASMEYLVTTRRDPLALVPDLRSLLRELDPMLPIIELRTVEQSLSETVATRRFLMMLLTGFAGVALALAAVGIYGVLAYLIGQRTREIGIRMALGAARRDVLGLVLVNSLKSVLPGVLFGIAGALLLSRLLAAQLYGVAPTDPATFAVVTTLLIAVALLASWLPARRAANVEPIVSLKTE